MENFIVSARKYRPDTFNSVVGQASITSTLKNAIKTGQLGHAYLFSGPRGVGKTTCARIFAKTINCQNPTDKIEPCNACESCTSFSSNRAFNIHELDAASNNSVEDIRSLTEQVRIPPQVGKYSLYIIDEVHMLSQQAFNAFLKTLEEPPKHAIFILATTEKHRILPTILSRCQIFDFNRIQTGDTVEYLKYIAGKEKISFEEEALHVIASKAEGAMRDALSIFDQVASFSERNITYDAVIENLNILDIEYYFKLTEAFLKNDIASALNLFNEILQKGFDTRNFINGLATHFRDLLVSRDEQTIELLDVGAAIRDRYLAQSKTVPLEFIFDALTIAGDAEVQLRGSKNQRLTIELALVQLSTLTGVQKKKVTEHHPPAESGQTGSTGNQKKPPAPKQPSEASSPEEPPEEDSEERKENGKENQVVHTHSISIKDALSGKGKAIPVKEDEIDEADLVVSGETAPVTLQSIDPEEVLRHWNAYAESIKKQQPRIYNTLIEHPPVVTPEGIIRIELTTHAQRESFIHRVKPNLIAYLRKHLLDIDYQVESDVRQTEKNGKTIYTDQDKLEYLVKKNPALEKFRKHLKLDFDE
jgi:DNA polymerase-3 subunit gamma/tau